MLSGGSGRAARDEVKPMTNCSRTTPMYAAPNRLTTHRLGRLDVPAPAWMRAPGECPGMYALESAMDELVIACGLDPIELRIRNEPVVDPETRHPFSSRGLVECLREGRSASAGNLAIQDQASVLTAAGSSEQELPLRPILRAAGHRARLHALIARDATPFSSMPRILEQGHGQFLSTASLNSLFTHFIP
jgi:hypothetical protein